MVFSKLLAVLSGFTLLIGCAPTASPVEAPSADIESVSSSSIKLISYEYDSSYKEVDFVNQNGFVILSEIPISWSHSRKLIPDINVDPYSPFSFLPPAARKMLSAVDIAYQFSPDVLEVSSAITAYVTNKKTAEALLASLQESNPDIEWRREKFLMNFEKVSAVVKIREIVFIYGSAPDVCDPSQMATDDVGIMLINPTHDENDNEKSDGFHHLVEEMSLLHQDSCT